MTELRKVFTIFSCLLLHSAAFCQVTAPSKSSALQSQAYTIRDLEAVKMNNWWQWYSKYGYAYEIPKVEETPARGERVSLERSINFLSSETCDGRATGTRGAMEATAWIARSFSRHGLTPCGNSWFQSFQTNRGDNTVIGRNILGILYGGYSTNKYLIVGAHYDGLGNIGGNIYPGADSNASGVAAMIELARSLHMERIGGTIYKYNIIFVAMDAKSPSMDGARTIVESIRNYKLTDPRYGRKISLSDIVGFVNLDILGSTLAPVNKGQDDYLIMLAGKNESWKKALIDVNERYGTGMDLSFDYYGSEDFTELFYNRVSEQKVFLDAGIPSVMFTSGITMKTNLQDDRPETLDYNILSRRIHLIFRWIVSIL